jgi:hypothetical protein
MNNLKASLAFFSKEELSVLQKIVKSDTNTVESITYKLERILFSRLYGVFQPNDSYKKLLEKIAKKNDVILDLNSKEVASERDLYFKLFKREIDQMQPKELETFYLDLEKQGLTRAQATSISGLATIGAAQASGFGVYVLASSTVGAIASVVGVTLPFAFYTGLSTAISYAIGPLGLLVLGYSAYKTIKSFDDFVDIVANTVNGIKKAFVGDYERATLAFKYIAAMRFLLDSNFQKTIKEINEGINRLQINNSNLQYQISINNVALKTVSDKIFEIEKEFKRLQSEKIVMNTKNRNLEERINRNNQNQKKIDTELKIQEESYRNFKSTLSK